MEAALISHHSCPESRRLTNRSSCTDVSAEQLWSSTCQRLLLQLEQLQSLAIASFHFEGMTSFTVYNINSGKVR